MVAHRRIAYDILHPAKAVFDLADPTLANLAGERPVFFVLDRTLVARYADPVERYARQRLANLGTLHLSGAEIDKSIENVIAICSAAQDAQLPRHGVFIAVGGGVVLDTVGFAASMYRRGVSFIRIPTTLIGMIDVGVGIKQGVNFGQRKNFLGSFYAPLGTINDRSFLWELPRRHLVCGLAEALKMGLICDPNLFELIEANGPRLLDSGFRLPGLVADEIIARAELAMVNELAENIYEHDLRRLVDFGHTFSPIIETSSLYDVAHGEAVALDMLLSTALSVVRSYCDPALLPRLVELFANLGLPTAHAAMSPSAMTRALDDARAHRGGALNLVLPVSVGECTFVQDVSPDELGAALHHITLARSAAA